MLIEMIKVQDWHRRDMQLVVSTKRTVLYVAENHMCRFIGSLFSLLFAEANYINGIN
jgi:hypothetical protein